MSGNINAFKKALRVVGETLITTPDEFDAALGIFRATKSEMVLKMELNSALAEHVLKLNTNNRPVGERYAVQKSHKIKDGLFVNLASDVAVGVLHPSEDETELNFDRLAVRDGQHTLIAASKQDSKSVVALKFTPNPAYFAVVDSGKKRSPADTLALFYQNLKNLAIVPDLSSARAVSGAIPPIYQLLLRRGAGYDGRPEGNLLLETATVMNFVEGFDISDEAIAASSGTKVPSEEWGIADGNDAAVLLPRSLVGAALLLRKEGESLDDIKAFFQKLSRTNLATRRVMVSAYFESFDSERARVHRKPPKDVVGILMAVSLYKMLQRSDDGSITTAEWRPFFEAVSSSLQTGTNPKWSALSDKLKGIKDGNA